MWKSERPPINPMSPWLVLGTLVTGFKQKTKKKRISNSGQEKKSGYNPIAVLKRGPELNGRRVAQ